MLGNLVTKMAVDSTPNQAICVRLRPMTRRPTGTGIC